MILRYVVGRMFGTNCFIVGCEETQEGMIIDPGERGDEIIELVQELGLKIKYIALTHTHMDHLGALGQVKGALGGEVLVHQAEAEFGRGGMRRMAGVFTGRSQSPPTPPDRLLKDGDTIEVGKLRFQVLHTPGHSLGGISLYGEGVVFTGDALFADSIGRTDFPGCSEAQLADSVMNKLMALPDETIVLPGHMSDSTIGRERRTNPFIREWRARGYGTRPGD